MAAPHDRLAWAILGLALTLAGCSPGPLVDRVPESLGGLPAGAPARPTTPYQYPAVHDMPPPRATKPMTEEELYQAEKSLRAVRDRQEARTAADRPPETKKKPAAPISGQNTGAKANP